MATPVFFYATSVQTNCLASGMPRFKWTLPPESGPIQYSAYAFDQDFEQRVDQFPPAAKNTLASTSSFLGTGSSFTTSILTSLSQPQNTWGMNVKYTGTFQVVPQTWNDIKSMPFTFPGFPGLIGQTGSRDPFTDNVDVRLQFDYYVLDPANILGGSPTAGGGVANAASLTDSGGNAVKTVYDLQDIPLITKTFFVVAYGGTPDYTNRTNSLTPSGGVSVNGVAWFQSLPTKAHYQSWITSASTYAWQSLVWNGTTDGAGSGNGYGQLVSDDSKIQAWQGNIIERVTSFVLVK